MQPLEQIFGSKNNVRVLRYLIKHPDWEFNITELSNDTKINKDTLSRLIKRLSENNAVRMNKKGKILLFKLNKENLLIKNLIIPSFKIEDSLFDNFIKPKIIRLRSKNIISIILYGSYSKGDFRLNSDLDLLIVVKNKNKELQNKINDLRKNFLEEDLLLRVDVMNLNEFRKLHNLKEPLLLSIEKNNKRLYGKSFNEIIK